ncbi:hypothetical protein, partial [Metapseudomonas otitidis]|uniref:hypothetical protein n=1 Tax=Metapseudomonas otitidis TaxID=319939 RepID=UPI0019800518
DGTTGSAAKTWKTGNNSRQKPTANGCVRMMTVLGVVAHRHRGRKSYGAHGATQRPHDQLHPFLSEL